MVIFFKKNKKLKKKFYCACEILKNIIKVKNKIEQ